MMGVVGLVLVSHSRDLAVAVEALVRQMTGPAARIALAAGAGDDQTDLGTDATAIVAAIEALDSDAGMLVLMDIGSALLSAELALDLLEPGVRSRVALCAAPFVEGALAAGVAASGGASLARVRREAEQSLTAKHSQLGVVPSHDTKRAEPDDRDGVAIDNLIDKLVPITDPAGLHLRPAAVIARYAQGQPHMIRIGVAETGREADAKSLTSLLGLGAREGMVLRITTSSAVAVDAIAGILEASSAPAAPPAIVTPGGPHPVSPGVAIGPATVLAAALPALPDRTTDAPDEAIAALDAALARARSQPAGAHDILAAQHALLDDPALRDAAVARIRHDHADAATAWTRTIEAAAAAIAGLDDPTLAARAADLRDAAIPVLLALGVAPAAEPPRGGAILIVDDLAASLAARLTRETTPGVIDRAGSATSHAAILLRAAGIPYVVGAGALAVTEGMMLAFDGATGTIWRDPDAATLARLEAQATDETRRAALPSGGTLILADGSTLEFWANVATVDQAVAARRQNAVGIGLLRTEFLFLDRATAPGAEEQADLLRAIIAPMQGRPVVIRALDAGADKPLAFLPPGAEPNPALGRRGLRALLAHADLFETQLRAMLIAGCDHDVRIMLPMVTNPDEFTAAHARLYAAHTTLLRAGQRHAWPVPLGIMIEVPAAALGIEAFAGADFASIGTNDLTQYTLAADRVNPALAALGDASHPVVVALYARIMAHARMPVSVCGEAAGDPGIAPYLIRAGLRRLSMVPASFGLVRHALERQLR